MHENEPSLLVALVLLSLMVHCSNFLLTGINATITDMDVHIYSSLPKSYKVIHSLIFAHTARYKISVAASLTFFARRDVRNQCCSAALFSYRRRYLRHFVSKVWGVYELRRNFAQCFTI